ncbi:hypothetical protein HO483_10285 [Streptococcus suis]|uniref:Uncharacterized protein n=1 Tax=Streptococcus suis TaxID=1307 RepID=A0A3R8T738_STRSU|nr:Imm70 family immunity protein [Streptococcus suis]WNF86541.1 Imm70 family immunity protein [Streptococcus parasuis]NQK68605.1 hypothetical protein [Streptococcus suis]NQP64969.1 hypothetical protein [Streptococcus suis]RRR51195.1 hypothetical protein EI998_09145 [Streptococcus suis]HEL2575999.1 hypothetical protein [Streptococcus suis]
MSVALKVGLRYYTVGSVGFLNSFFSTVFIRLENSKWGSRYPILMNELYYGRVSVYNLKDCLLELQNIRIEFSKLSSYDNVWDFENLEASAPWGNQICSEIKLLSDYFITLNGSNLLDMMIRVFEHAISVEKPVEISTI